jgi:hypothetical protein
MISSGTRRTEKLTRDAEGMNEGQFESLTDSGAEAFVVTPGTGRAHTCWNLRRKRAGQLSDFESPGIRAKSS